jgi:hypothetical protein
MQIGEQNGDAAKIWNCCRMRVQDAPGNRVEEVG